jgi:hypothetical protein
MNPADETDSVPAADRGPETMPQPPADVARLAATATAPPGPRPRTIGGYELLGEPLGGGMGDVFRARHAATGRVVALKMIRGDLLADRVLLDRFRAEAQAVAAIRHPHVVRLIEYGEHAGAPYLALEYLPGGTLADRLRAGGRMPPAAAAGLVAKVASAVQVGHDLGIVHRDLKPGNILFDEAGEPRVVDFGLAKWAGFDLTRSGATMGTPRYMAPEQADGSGAVTAATDVWALGVMLFECLTGARAFAGDTVEEVMANVLAARPSAFPPQDPPVPDALRLVCERCLRKRPAERYPSAAALAAVLTTYVSPPADAAETTLLPVAQLRRPNRWLERLLIAAGAAALAGVTVGYWPRAVPPTVQPAADPGPEPRVTLAAEAGPVWALAFLGPDELVAGYEDGAVRVLGLRAQEVVRTLDPRLRGNVWAADVAVDRRDAGARRDGGNAPGWVVPPSRLLVTPSDDQEVAVWDLDSFRVYRRYPHPTSTKAAAFSPDALYLATGDRAGAVRVWNQDAQVPVELGGHAGTVHALGYSPDGRWLASAGSDGVRVWDARELDWDRWEGPARPTHAPRLHKGPVYAVAFDPASTHLATAGWDGTVRVWEAATGRQVQQIRAHDGDAWSVSFGGGRLASAGSDGVKVWDVATGQEVFAYRGGRGFHVVRFGPDGHTLAAGGRAGNIRVWDLPK